MYVLLNNEVIITMSKLISVFVAGSDANGASPEVRLLRYLESSVRVLSHVARGTGLCVNDSRLLPAGVRSVLVVLVVSSTEQYSLNSQVCLRVITVGVLVVLIGSFTSYTETGLTSNVISEPRVNHSLQYRETGFYTKYTMWLS